MAIVFPDKEDYCIIDEKDGVEIEQLDDDGVKEKGKEKNVIGQFYFVKINYHFVDPALKMRIQNFKNSINHLHKTKTSVRYEIEDREVVVQVEGSLYYRTGLQVYGNYYPLCSTMSCLRHSLNLHWPHSIDEDPEEAVDLELEVQKIKKKIKELSYQLSHGTQKLDRIRKEIKELKRKHDVLAKEVNEVVARGPSNSYSKYEIQRKMGEILPLMRKSFEWKIIEMKPKHYRPKDFNQQLLFIEQEEDAIQKRIARTSPKLNKQVTIFEDYVSTIKKAKDISTNKNLIALAKLSSKQVDELMNKWKNEEAFRENYKRSIQKSLNDRGLAEDGRML